ncbi:MAG: proton-conducting transporter membrane subunit [Planctomycetaceae bacterium]
MNSTQMILCGAACSALSGLPALLSPVRSRAGQLLSATMNVAGCGCGLAGVWSYYSTGDASLVRFPAPIPGFEFTAGLDGLSAFFLVPVLVVCALASIYGTQYWSQHSGAENARRVSVFLGLMTSAMMMLVSAADGLLFLFGWEVMAVSTMFLVSTEEHLAETRRAAWLYIAASHLATLCAFGVFALLYAQTGSFGYSTLPNSTSTAAIAMAVLGLVGFGTKAGLMPLHVWLPGAHAAAPSHVSAVMSGVMLKMGIYGIFRTASFFPQIPLSWGLVTLAAGTITAVLGIAFAVSQRDFKRLLAYSSVENIGIIVMGLGLALIGRATGRPEWVMLGICGALLHVWNHAFFKSMMFFAAGSVIHCMTTRDLDVMGGLSRRMPVTATCFVIGAVAICGLPPLNGFVSELMIYIGLFGTLPTKPGETESLVSTAAFATPALALVGALAVACFVKVYGIVFLGAARSETAASAHESGHAMTAPMIVLAAFCVLIGVAPVLVVSMLERAAGTWAAADTGATADLAELSLRTVFPLGPVSIIAGILISLVAVGTILLQRRVRSAPSGLTWDCGYAAPSATMQYSSSSFAQWLVNLFRWALKPTVHPPKIDTLFPENPRFETQIPDTVLERAVKPMTRNVKWLFGWSRFLQQGSLQAYLLYILVIVVCLLLWRPGG